jgi:hypothetical protein
MPSGCLGSPEGILARLPGLRVGHASVLHSGGTRSGRLVGKQIAAAQPIDVHLCLGDVPSQGGRIQPSCVAVRARDIATFGPGQLGGHLPQLIA